MEVVGKRWADGWTVGQEGEDGGTDTEGRRWMGTRGRGCKTRDMMGGVVQGRKRSRDTEEGGYWHPSWAGQAAEARSGIPRISLGSWHSRAFPSCSPGGLGGGLPQS